MTRKNRGRTKVVLLSLLATLVVAELGWRVYLGAFASFEKRGKFFGRIAGYTSESVRAMEAGEEVRIAGMVTGIRVMQRSLTSPARRNDWIVWPGSA